MIFLRGARDVGSLCSFEGPPEGWSRNLSVAIARGKHLFPFRTEKLSLSAPMVLGSQGPGRVGRRRLISTKGSSDRAALRLSGGPCSRRAAREAAGFPRAAVGALDRRLAPHGGRRLARRSGSAPGPAVAPL